MSAFISFCLFILIMFLLKQIEEAIELLKLYARNNDHAREVAKRANKCILMAIISLIIIIFLLT